MNLEWKELMLSKSSHDTFVNHDMISYRAYIDGLEQTFSIAIANTLEILQSCN